MPHALIDSRAIAHNLQQIQARLHAHQNKRCAPSRVWAVVKANAYGHGLPQVLSGLASAQGLAVHSIDEAHACRDLGWRKPLLILAGVADPEALRNPALHPVHLVISHPNHLETLARSTAAPPVFAWLRLRGRLNQTGFNAADYPQAYAQLITLQHRGRVSGTGHLAHYAQAEDPRHLHEERRDFAHVIRDLPGPVCTDNSAALLMQPAQARQTDWVRTGITLYGISPLPSHTADTLGLQAAMTLQAPLVDIKPLMQGDTLGYGADFQAPHDMAIGLVGCGYAHGYPRLPGAGAAAWCNGRRRPIIGRVSMEMLAIDLSAGPPCSLSDPVILWGHPQLPIEDVAHAAGTIPAQLCTALTAQVARVSV